MDEAVEKLLPAVEEQRSSPETPYVGETIDRLLAEPDIDEAEAMAMVAFCLADEIEAMMASGRPFDANRYQMLLDLLPVMPEGR